MLSDLVLTGTGIRSGSGGGHDTPGSKKDQ